MRFREILFKAKRKNWKELPKEQWWVEGYVMKQPTGEWMIVRRCDNPPDGDPMWEKALITYEIEYDTICQYTGLTDRNNNKIWENDVVEFLGHRGNIVFGCGSFGIAFKNTIDWDEIEDNILPYTGSDNNLYSCQNDNFISLWEVYWNFNEEDECINMIKAIGNIFDNPELLKGSEQE